ncbi:beta-2 adrenergic receptor-like [Lytechinus pictus]|uniref:beta-2 adrenergic receptor-like n=1 Tax=Lytechinus pictus TaxID=7653 RepID=UPI0030B9B98A
MSATFFGLMTVLTFVFNLCALVVLHRWRNEFEEISRTLFFNLAILNLSSGVSTGIFQGMLIYLDRGEVSERLCHFLPFIGTYMVFTSTYEVALLNLQRYLAISYPFRYVRFATVKRVIVLCTVFDFIFIGMAIPFLPVPNFPFNVFIRSWCHQHTILYNRLDDGTLGSNIYIYYAMYGLLYITPFMVITYSNVRLLIIARRVSRRRHHVVPVQHNEEAGNMNSSTPGLKGLRTVLIITGLFYLSIIPLLISITSLVLPTPLSVQSLNTLFVVANAFQICSCWWNVPVYMSTSAELRQRALQLCQRINCFRKA